MWENVKNLQNNFIGRRFHNETKPPETFHCGIDQLIFDFFSGDESNPSLTSSTGASSLLPPASASATASSNIIRIEGYLFKRGQRAFKTWNRRWFYLENNKLCYSKRTGDEVTIMEENLRICLVRPLTDIDRRFCFEIISPTKSHVLQVRFIFCLA